LGRVRAEPVFVEAGIHL